MKVVITIIIILFSSFIQAQNVEFHKKNFSSPEAFDKAVEAIETGNDLFFEGNFRKALPLFLEAQDLNAQNSLLNFKIGVCYLKNDEVKKSMPYFETAKQLDPKVDPKVDLALAKSYQANEKFQEAIDAYKYYLSVLSKSKKLTEEPEVQKSLDICRLELQKKESEKQGKEAVDIAKNKPSTKLFTPKKTAKITSKPVGKAIKTAPEAKVPVRGSSSEIRYRIQIASASTPASKEELEKIYSGNLKISHQKVGAVYKYFIGNFKTKDDALKTKIASGIPEAFIVRFKAGKKM